MTKKTIILNYVTGPETSILALEQWLDNRPGATMTDQIMGQLKFKRRESRNAELESSFIDGMITIGTGLYCCLDHAAMNKIEAWKDAQ